mmetsp:Transcript_47722/g.102248  ORF Transcript_47722/g.102248 Transcript_47722/m.102248 type:complete len:550 (+) Transcript_47722:58-1707(+)|eukprot:CAMPEP_0206452530 /NCGR_PEP_ID=MMETSP0324_2-20121206/20003_1 /ASSEMBLY_ACC=CAM_ASM_000836 /TAXON_ID=2866 /ORGANISM="Crypthecodinium cohnii, Strain Seligo" /LENGTH=549 /DNA_ID=CAMNT_0053922643 /DNA_START=52 /DNA_END=1701 /DNA_ORIENTATION=-
MPKLTLTVLCLLLAKSEGTGSPFGDSDSNSPQTCNADSDEAGCPTSGRGSHHLMLQLARSGHRDLGPAVTGETNTCKGMPDIKKSCSQDSCLVLATGMTHHTCHDYCAQSGRQCLEAWEEVNNDCNVKETLTCDSTYGDTSDLLCRCSSSIVGLDAVGAVKTASASASVSSASVSAASAAASAASSSVSAASTSSPCDGLEDVEETCKVGTNSCRVRADKMTWQTCESYCQRNGGRTCIWAGEEIDETCSVLEEISCTSTYKTSTSDLLCECKWPDSALGSAATYSPSPASSTSSAPLEVSGGEEWKLVWSDEFNGYSVDTSKWDVVNKGGGFGNAELQFYTPNNAQVANGVLSITAKCDNYQGHSFTSSKLQTKGKAQWGPGVRVEVRAKVPNARGTWPAIWMLPVSNAYGNWPYSGEIDIMETVGCSTDTIWGTVHTGAFNHMKNTQAFNTVPAAVTDWHTYTLRWEKAGLEWYIDDVLYGAFSPTELDSSDKWPYNQEFYLILNLAVGGSWGASCLGGQSPSCASSDFGGSGQVMEVDYARIYAKV